MGPRRKAIGAKPLDDVGKTVLDAEDRVFDLETPNFWHKQGGRERNPLRPCRPAAPVPDPPYDLHEPPKSRYRRQLPGQAGPSQSRTPFRQDLPAPEGNSRQVLLSGRGRQTFVGAPSRRDNHPQKTPGPDNYAASWFNTPTWDPLSFFPPPPWDPRGFLGIWSTYLGPRGPGSPEGSAP